MRIKFMLEERAYAPEKAHEDDAGWDLRTPYSFSVFPHDSRVIDTGIHVQIPSGYVGMIKSKSGLNTTYSLTTEGVIDAGYTGGIKVKIYNHGNAAQVFLSGDKITQLVILPIPKIEGFDQVDSLEETERGDNGFGSSGR